ncbi:MAG TPA: hypothetical protein VIY47_03050 [Ignavibacteriaceae bacterium]
MFQLQIRRIREAYPQAKIIVLWECEFERLLSAPIEQLSLSQQDVALELRMFMATEFQERPVGRLNVRGLFEI